MAVVYTDKNNKLVVTKVHDMYFSKKKYLDEFKSRIVHVLKTNVEISKDISHHNFNRNNIRLWRTNINSFPFLK